MSPSWGLGTGEGALGSWAAGHGTIAVGNHLHLLGRGGPIDMEGSGQVMSPQKMLHRPSASNLATINSTCWEVLGLQVLHLQTLKAGLMQLAEPLKEKEKQEG